MGGTRRLDIELHLDRSQQARVEAEARADSKKTAQQIISDAALIQTGAAMMGLQSASAVISGVKAELDKAAANAQKTAEEILKMPGAIRELAALRGELSGPAEVVAQRRSGFLARRFAGGHKVSGWKARPTQIVLRSHLGAMGPTTDHVLGVQAQTLQSAEDVNSMEQSGLGIGELAIGKTISKENFDKSMVAAGRMQTLEGGSASAYGALTGQLALQSDHMLSPEEVQARINRMYEIQKPGGFTNMSQAIEQNSQLSQLVMNGILTPEQSMGTLSAFSAVGPPGQAATTTNQFVRATLGNQVRAKGMQVDPELDTEKTGAANEPYEIARRMTFAELKKNGAMYRKYEDWNSLSPGNEFFADTAALRDPGSNSYTALREKTRSNLEREARRLNLKIEDPTSVFDVDRDQKLARQIQGAGGDVTGSTTMQSLESGAKSFERRMKRVEDALAPKVPAPVQGKPNQPRLRP
jgi:hypothetical protein